MTRAIGAPVTRLPAAERRRALVDAALTVFSAGSYAGATTAEIAREAGVSEPILYRHFTSKRELYLACLDEVWARLRSAWEKDLAGTSDPADSVVAMSRTVRRLKRRGEILPGTFWIQALIEAGEEREIRSHLRRQLREVHEFVSGAVRRAQAAEGVPAERDPRAEAWVLIALSLLVSFGTRLGGLLRDEDLEAIADSRLRRLSAAGS